MLLQEPRGCVQKCVFNGEAAVTQWPSSAHSWLRQGMERHLYWTESRDLRVPLTPGTRPKWILCTFLESLQECQCLRAVKHLKALILYAQSPAPLGPLLYLHKQPRLERYSVVHGCFPSKMLFTQNHLSSFLFPFLPLGSPLMSSSILQQPWALGPGE